MSFIKNKQKRFLDATTPSLDEVSGNGDIIEMDGDLYVYNDGFLTLIDHYGRKEEGDI